MYWNKTFECMDRGELVKYQTKALQDTVKLVYKNVPSYREKMQQSGVKPEDIRTITDLKYLPFTVKQDLRDHYPYGMFASPLSDIVRIHASSGTTGKPTVVGYTQGDIGNWSDMMARSFTAAGADKNSIIQVAFGYGLFTGGLGAHYGVERIGASVIPISGGNTKRQIMIMQDFGTTILACTPSYALFLAETMEEMGIKKGDLKLKAGIFGAEPWSEEMRQDIEEKLGIKALDIYGLSEVMGPGVSYECECECGMHINEDFFIPEIIDPDTLEPLPYGEKGELVFTTINKMGIPLIRYRTRDISTLNADQCECGRTFVRMSKVLGRTDDMLIIRGVNVFPSQIEGVLSSIAEVSPHFMILVDRVNGTDALEVQVEVLPEIFSDEVKSMESLKKKIGSEIQSVLNISVGVTLVEPKTIARTDGKAKRVIDNRKF